MNRRASVSGWLRIVCFGTQISWFLLVSIEGKAIEWVTPQVHTIATSPKADFSVEIDSKGDLWVVSSERPSNRVPLGQSSAGGSENPSSGETAPVPPVFVSPDANWIFLQRKSQNDSTDGFLYRRADGLKFETFGERSLADQAFSFYARTMKLDEKSIGLPDENGNRSRSIGFVAWSADSSRLLVSAASTIGKPNDHGGWEGEFGPWCCYLNTRKGELELTERLQKFNAVAAKPKDESSLATDADDQLIDQEPRSAESTGQEGPQDSVKQRFARADANLNNVYGDLMKKL
jgi:hypothetical protein